MKFLLVVKGDYKTVEKELEKRDIPMDSASWNDSWEHSMVYVHSDNLIHLPNFLIEKFNRWIGESNKEPYPDGTLLFWNEVL